MDTTTNRTALAQTTWAAFTPVYPVLPEARYEEFFETAPQGTLVEVYGDLFLRGYGVEWQELEHIREGNEYYGADHNEQTPAQLISWASRPRAEVRILRVGPAARTEVRILQVSRAPRAEISAG
jgi:hypothetical protein